jgi:hypothetical protein
MYVLFCVVCCVVLRCCADILANFDLQKIQFNVMRRTALHLAAAAGHVGIVDALLSAGADLTLLNVCLRLHFVSLIFPYLAPFFKNPFACFLPTPGRSMLVPGAV